MNRRAYLVGLASMAVSPLAGCGGARPAPLRHDADTPTPRSTLARPRGDLVLPVPQTELMPAMHSVIPAIIEPAYGADWTGIEIEVGSTTYEPRLRSGEPVIGVRRGETARAYPLAVLERHEVVNDWFPTADGADDPLLVTYCPSCGSSMTVVRRVGGEAATFEVSHFLWRSNLVLRDLATSSLWSHILATAIRGPATGAALSFVPSTLTSWGSWRADHPDTRVLLPPPLSETIWNVSPPPGRTATTGSPTPIPSSARTIGAGRSGRSSSACRQAARPRHIRSRPSRRLGW